MKKLSLLFLITLVIVSCKEEPKTPEKTLADIVIEQTQVVQDSTDFREFKVLDSKYINSEYVMFSVKDDLDGFTEGNYNELKALIIDQDIPTLQSHILNGKLSYENLTKFFLYRIGKYDRNNDLSLNSIIALNANAVEAAKQKDEILKSSGKTLEDIQHSVFGMPILLKDNINADGMMTTAGAAALANNKVSDAFVVERLKENGAIILGKANLSEWAYFFCGDCPSGYSAYGGQTLNPYGRRVFDTGGSSSGSGVSATTNFAVAAIGSETAGSILSPASSNSAVGIKPTIGLLSRGGVVPISSTLDTTGPITKNVIDNAIVLSAMIGKDNNDSASFVNHGDGFNYADNLNVDLKGKRFGAIKGLLQDTLYTNAVNVLKGLGAEIVEIDQERVNLPGFSQFLTAEMKIDLPTYFNNYGDQSLNLKNAKDVVAFNDLDSLKTAPYGQRLFHGIVTDSTTKDELNAMRDVLRTNGRKFFDTPMDAHNLDGILSINNFHAGFAAVALYPALTVPMGYRNNGQPRGLTFIAKSKEELKLLSWAKAYEDASKMRVSPKNYN
ncbi:amidase family protein [Winogradskyella immobilis]|uniref:Amidase n=1 Tax=Winogradskyella immobilis TaxID=2816852 RepID=A0ABS8EPJ7_9FLAO|nr:amidase family protein [Winogradskyella immobilis]MCC1485148.1 amidase [Winogradskyella immobilis]MCG0017240.1 amidase [Winogradskyella immobilis]